MGNRAQSGEVRLSIQKNGPSRISHGLGRPAISTISCAIRIGFRPVAASTNAPAAALLRSSWPFTP
jgi:hypothetical protein